MTSTTHSLDFDLVGCGACVIAPACGLTSVLDEALLAFPKVLNGYSLADARAYCPPASR